MSGGQFPYRVRRDTKQQRCSSTDRCWEHHGREHISNFTSERVEVSGHYDEREFVKI